MFSVINHKLNKSLDKYYPSQALLIIDKAKINTWNPLKKKKETHMHPQIVFWLDIKQHLLVLLYWLQAYENSPAEATFQFVKMHIKIDVLPTMHLHKHQEHVHKV